MYLYELCVSVCACDILQRIEMLNQQTEAFKDETSSKQQRLRFLQSRFPTVNVRDDRSVVR